MDEYKPDDPAVIALMRLCELHGGYKGVAAEIEANDQTIYQIVAGIRLPSGNYRGVGPLLRKKLTARFPDWLAAHEPPNVLAVDHPLGRVPLISWVAAGDWCNVENPYEVGDAEDWLICPIKHGPRTYALRVVGLSMFDPAGEKSFKDGDYIFVDPDRDYMHRSLVIARLDDESKATFKRLLIEGDQKMLEALNPAWPNRIMQINGRASMCGVVIAKMESYVGW